MVRVKRRVSRRALHAAVKRAASCSDIAIGYAELHALSCFSFQRGASSADELFARAAALGYAALAITDECSMAGIVRALEASETHGVDLVVGTEVQLADGPKLVLLATGHDGYSDLCRLITLARRRSTKGSYRLVRDDLTVLGSGVLVLWPPRAGHDDLDAEATWLHARFATQAWIAVELHRAADDADWLATLRALGERHRLALVASGDVHMHARGRRVLQDVMTAIRLGCAVAEAGHALFANGERHLRRRDDLAALYPPDLLAESLRIAARCTGFDLRTLDYVYPGELVPAGRDAASHLRALTFEGARRRWPAGIPTEIAVQLERELDLIRTKRYEHFFLTVEDIVRHARTLDPPILCQGRGSSANSAVCYALGITSVRPEDGHLLFERFISLERDEPPDIDVDFEHERREEIIQYVFSKYGRERAAIAATVICYRGRSAARDVGRALGLGEDRLEPLGAVYDWANRGATLDERLRERGFDPASALMHRLVVLVEQLVGFPRHLSQHVGGFVISEHPLHALVPVENAAMPGRTIIQWDKDDLESMKLLKVDCLALGMLSCLRRCFDLLRRHEKRQLELYMIPPDDKDTYAMIQRADTVGVFQIESRAQMSMLPRLKPKDFYDLVIQIAIVRPGPIQGGMVHPYLRRRSGEEKVDYPQSRDERAQGGGASRVKEVLERTLGVPIFQEQVMKLVQVIAGFTPGRADALRRAMAAWKRKGGLEPFRDEIRAGMLANGYDEAYFERIFEQIKGFGDYGFPESHSASFAHLAYASSWIKCHHPAVLTCALLNSLPMGFYAPAQLVKDAQRHGVRVLPVDVTASEWDCTLEAETVSSRHAHALRLGFARINGFAEASALRIERARAQRPFTDLADLVQRAGLDARDRARLADADALRSLVGHRHQARWDVAASNPGRALLAGIRTDEVPVPMPPPTLRGEVLADYGRLGFSLRRHPLSFVRARLDTRRVLRTRDALGQAHGHRVHCVGLVTVRQRPGTAKGVTFVTIEDETGFANIIVWRTLAERQRRILLDTVLLGVEGRLQSSHGVCHIVAERLSSHDALLADLGPQSRDFH
ncbi:MAG: error-prone DNA polymerase [Xanthomonadales bacterium]|nr:error-prone DNA polymerase [Xanthomonadales bacterium]